MIKILVVDDRPINREALSVLLNEHNYEVLEAENGIQAMELLGKNEIHLIITDIVMPQMDGLSLVKEIQMDPTLRDIPIIFYSASYKAAEAHRLAHSFNIQYVLTKPCDPGIILSTIEDALNLTSRLTDNAFQSSSTKKNQPPEGNIHLEKREKLEQINLRLTNIIEISLDMSLEYNLEKLIYIVCKGGRQFLNACYSGVILKDLENPNQLINFFIGKDNALNTFSVFQSHLSATLEEIFINEKIVCMHSPVIDLGKIGLEEISLPFSSLLSLPLKTSRTRYGKIYFITKFNRKVFTPSDQRFMMTLADKFVVNYENLILYKEVEKHAKKLENEIFQRKKAESVLQEMTDRLHLCLEAAHVGTWSWTIQGNQLNWDKHSCLLFGIESENFEGTLDSFLSRIVLDDRGRVKKELLSICKNAKDQSVAFRVGWPDGSIRHLMLRGKMDYNSQGEPIRMLGVYWDITEQIQTEEKLRNYREKMEEVVRSTSLGEVASSLAHELNQPLAAINAYVKGCIYRVETHKAITPEIVEILHETALQAERAGEVVHRIKSFLRKGELFYEAVNLNALIEETIHLLQQEAQRYAIQIIYKKNEQLPQIEIDKIQIQQVILNLLRNAMEAMQEVKTSNPHVIIETEHEKNDRIFLKIIDNGPGFSEETAKQLFDLYFTTKTNGMGLGLAISRSIIEAHSGQLSASVLAGGGSCFQMDLPIKTLKNKGNIAELVILNRKKLSAPI